MSSFAPSSAAQPFPAPVPFQQYLTIPTIPSASWVNLLCSSSCPSTAFVTTIDESKESSHLAGNYLFIDIVIESLLKSTFSN